MSSDRTTPSASSLTKTVVLGAMAHAEALGDPAVGPEHLLLAALDLPDGDARRAFEGAGGDPDAVRDAIVATHEAALRTIGIEPVPEGELGPASSRSGPRPNKTAVRAIKHATEGASRDRTKAVGAHVVAAVARLEQGTAARILRAMEVDPAELFIAARAEAGASKARREAARDAARRAA